MLLSLPYVKEAILGYAALATIAAVFFWGKVGRIEGELNQANQTNSIAMTALKTNERALNTAKAVADSEQQISKALEEENSKLSQKMNEDLLNNVKEQYQRELDAKEDRIRGGRISSTRINTSLRLAADDQSSDSDEITVTSN